MRIAHRSSAVIAAACLVLFSPVISEAAHASSVALPSVVATARGAHCELKAAGSCRGIALRGQDLRNAQLSRIDLRGADLRGVNLRGANLSGALLANAKLRGAKLSSANLSAASLQGADLSKADLHLADLRAANLHGATLTSANLSRANLGMPRPTALLRMRMDAPAGCSATGGVVDCAGADLSGADLQDANLANANLASTNLTGANLTGANLTGANLANANASGSNLTNAVLIGANVATTNLTSAILTGQDGMVPPASPVNFAACDKNSCGQAPNAGQMSTSWSPPSVNLSSPPVMEYVVICRNVSKPDQSAGPAGLATSFVFQGLQSLNNYSCYAYAMNAIGTGQSSPTSVGQAT